MTDRAEDERRKRRTRDRALILLILGLGFLMPPLAGIFHVETRVFGIPATLLYLFVVWAFLIIAAARLSNDLLRSADPESDREPRG